MGTDDVTGSLEAGKSADFVVLDRDPLAVPADQLAGTVVEETWFAGRKVHQRTGRGHSPVADDSNTRSRIAASCRTVTREHSRR
jgi:cytosine/adenosine deaminase-related metal-dependent hydrolase